HRLIEYLRACVEADSKDGLRVARNSQNCVYLTSGDAPVLGGTTPLPADRETTRWAKRRLVAGASETLIGGWPVITGKRTIDQATTEVAAPLLFTEMRVNRRDGAFELSATSDAVEV